MAGAAELRNEARRRSSRIMPLSTNIAIVEQTQGALSDYGSVPASFAVSARLRVDVLSGGLGGFGLVEEPVQPAYVKDYDADHDEGPTRWAKRWDICNWGVFAAFEGTVRVGGAVVAWKTDGVHMLEGRTDLGVLWDLRVRPERRRCGVGTQLFGAAVAWARRRGCRQLKVETHNTNVPACRFYARQGCVLGAIHRRAYTEHPEEAMLLWYLDL